VLRVPHWSCRFITRCSFVLALIHFIKVCYALPGYRQDAIMPNAYHPVLGYWECRLVYYFCYRYLYHFGIPLKSVTHLSHRPTGHQFSLASTNRGLRMSNFQGCQIYDILIITELILSVTLPRHVLNPLHIFVFVLLLFLKLWLSRAHRFVATSTFSRHWRVFS